MNFLMGPVFYDTVNDREQEIHLGVCVVQILVYTSEVGHGEDSKPDGSAMGQQSRRTDSFGRGQIRGV
jgi:hypothetical protein